MPIGKWRRGVDDQCVITDKVNIANIRAMGQRMRGRILQILGQHGTQRLFSAKAAVGRQKDIGRAPAQWARGWGEGFCRYWASTERSVSLARRLRSEGRKTSAGRQRNGPEDAGKDFADTGPARNAASL